MSNFVHEDGQGNYFNNEGLEIGIVETEVDEEMYPIEMVTNLDPKPPEKEVKIAVKQPKAVPESTETLGIYQHYRDSERH
ncbi:hypothetical protein BD770DRAFT_57532 [Pilaira anomala]|nr:hypothetical protein BD770DRAFT_57532 [Pilaira anomala]